ncbi:hypothetical protein AB1283_25945 [Bacillus sp. S13(2024)]|uniref:hypothetical protein n=1 Tax=Bacillus sp. S13(2024) TaxID=3162885 RepID=UPI003D21F038
MSVFIGLSAFGIPSFNTPTPPITNINSVDLKNTILDEAHLRDNVNDNSIISTNKDIWAEDTQLLATFNNTIEAGNIINDGIPIKEFLIKRRRVGSTLNTVLAKVPFNLNINLNYEDYTQAADDYIYSVTPVGINNLEGLSNEVVISVEFTGWYIIDKNNLNNIIIFDAHMEGSELVYTLQHNQGRTEIKTFSQYPTVFYDNSSYYSTTLDGLFYGTDTDKSLNTYRKIEDIINNHIPVIIKGGDGTLIVADLYNLRKVVPMNTWKGHDYFTAQIDVTETMSLEEYLSL